MALSTNLLFLDELASENHLHAIAIIIMMTRLRGHYVADIRSGICDPNARPTIVKETAGEQRHSNDQDCHRVKIIKSLFLSKSKKMPRHHLCDQVLPL